MSKFGDGIIAASQVSDSGGLLIFLTGSPGAGKTTLIGTLDDIPEYHGRLIILAAGHGILALADRPNIAVHAVEKWGVLKEASTYLTREEHPYRAVAIDVSTEAYQVGLREVQAEGLVTKHGQPTQEAYGVMNNRFIDMVRDFRILAETTGMHVIFTSHTDEKKDDERGTIMVRANLTPGTISNVLGAVDCALYLEQRQRRPRLLYLVGTERIWAKARKPLSYGPLPDTIENPTFAKIFEALAPQKEPVSR